MTRTSSKKPARTKRKEIIVSTRAASQLGLAIKRFRTYAELTQAELARDAGLRQATISKAEKGLGTTEIQTLYAICAALGLEVVLRPKAKTGELSVEELFQP
jgi:HTH-type transcriptional regulator/antitoxin HipB